MPNEPKKMQDPSPRAYTIRDIAAHIGVAPSTVSLVLNGRRYVTAEMRQKVLRACKELHYIRPGVGRPSHYTQLRNTTEPVVVFYTRNQTFNGGIYQVAFNAARAELRANGFDVVVMNNPASPPPGTIGILYLKHDDIALPVPEWRPQMLARMKFNLELIHDYGVDTCCFHICSRYRREYTMAQHMDAARRSLEELVPLAEELGVVICLENIFQPCNLVDDVLTLIKEFPSPCVGACFDIGHAHMMEQGMNVPNSIVPSHWEGVCPVPWEKNILDRMLPHIVNCHLHDNSAEVDTHTIPGMGTIDWAPAMAKLRTAPRLKNMQSEVIPVRRNGLPIRAIVESFDRILG